MTATELIRAKITRASPGSLFTVDDFSGSRSAVRTALCRLASERTLYRLRRGLYWKSSKARFGTGRPRLSDAVRKIAADRGIGPAGWTASYELGVSTQVPATPEFAIVGFPPVLPGVIFYTRWNLRRLGATYWEIGVLELLRAWPKYTDVTWPEFVRRVRDLWSRRAIDPKRMLNVASNEKSAVLRRNAEALGRELSNVDGQGRDSSGT